MRKFHDREKLYVLKNEVEVIGWGIIKRYSDREGYSLSCETAIYLRRSEMRKGYGSLMKRFLIEECRKMGYHHLVAKIFASNQASIQYNLKLGYEIVGRQKEIGILNGDWIDVVIMQYIIPQS
ncbi:MAG: GNAT family N-acetyltransferase [Bacteroidia bacterium]